jgi:hypothetical protein
LLATEHAPDRSQHGYRGGMGKYGELFPGRKLKHEGDQGAPGREHDPGGPLDLDRGVVFLAPPGKDRDERADDEPSQDDSGAAGRRF